MDILTFLLLKAPLVTILSQMQLIMYSVVCISCTSSRDPILTCFIETQTPMVHKNTSQPTLILVQTFGEIPNGKLPLEIFHKLSKYFERQTAERGDVLYKEGGPCDYLLVLEQGSLRSFMFVLNEEVTVETILPGTVVGELGIFSASSIRTRSLIAETHSVYWKLSRASFDRMCKEDPGLANQFILLTLYFSAERLDTMTRYAFHLH